MSMFGSLLGDVEDDPFFGSHMRHMRHMNNMMNSLFSDPFGMLGGAGPLAIMGSSHGNHGGALMPFMPQMPSMNRLFVDMEGRQMNAGSSFSSSTVVMSSGPHGKPQVYSSSSSTKIGPNGIKETRKTLQDSRTGTNKMSIGHHIGDRAHLIEREQNVYSGDAEERQEFINLEEDEAEVFDREFQQKAGSHRDRQDITSGRRDLPRLTLLPPPRLALPAPPPRLVQTASPPPLQPNAREQCLRVRPAPRPALRTSASPHASHSASVREVYGGSHPQRRHKHGKSHSSRNHDN